jgi:hypothetical protein
VQGEPFDLRPQELLTQVLGATQSLSRPQLDMHAPKVQTKVPHDRSAGATQLPWPSQADVGVSDDVLAHTAALQASPLAYTAQAPPRQAPVVPQLGCAVTWHCSCGSGERSGTGVQSPSEEGSAQDLQAAVQAELQHTPCAQPPDSHSPPALHSAPLGFFPQEPFTQKLPATQSASLVQPAKHTLPLQT